MTTHIKIFVIKAYRAFLIYAYRIVTIPFRSLITPQIKLNVIRCILKHNFLTKLYWFSGLYYLSLRQNLWNLNKNKLILIYQFGRVGSTTVYNSLKTVGMNVYKIHWLNRDLLKKHLKEKQLKNRDSYLHIYLSEVAFLNRCLEKGLDQKKLKLISLVREPVARNVAAFFRQFLFRFAHKSNTNQITCENLRDLFQKNWIKHDVPLIWFDMEMKPIFKIDVYSEEFSKSKGYKIYTGDHPDLLLIKLEKLNKCASEAFKEFLGIDGIILQNANLERDGPYYSLYRKFTSSKTLPRSYIEKMYNSKYAKHFYTEEELNIFRKKWS